MQKITAKQNNILAYLRDYIEQKKENPSAYKLLKYLGKNGIRESMKGLMQVLAALERKEIIKRDGKKIIMVKNEDFQNMENFMSIPLYGLASCGEALAFADDKVEDYLHLSRSLIEGRAENLFAVKSLGDSMDKDGINDGDYVLFKKYEGDDDLEGKIVVAVINGMATIKRYKKVGEDIAGLFPHSTNPVHHPIFIHTSDNCIIAGVFKKVLPVKYVSL